MPPEVAARRDGNCLPAHLLEARGVLRRELAGDTHFLALPARVALELLLRQGRHPVSAAHPVVRIGVKVVVQDLEVGADGGGKGEIHPAQLTPDFHVLPYREPPASIHPAVREFQAHAAHRRVDVGGRCERCRHAGDGHRGVVEVESSDDARIVLARRTYLDAVYLRRVWSDHDRGGVHEAIRVEVGRAIGDRVQNVLHLVALAHLDRAAEVLHHEAEVVDVVVNACGCPGDVAAADQRLQRSSFPRPLQLEGDAVRADGLLSAEVTEICEEVDVSLCIGVERGKRGIGVGVLPLYRGFTNDSKDPRAIPPPGARIRVRPTGGDWLLRAGEGDAGQLEGSGQGQEGNRAPGGAGQGPDPLGRPSSKKRLIIGHGKVYRRVRQGFPHRRP